MVAAKSKQRRCTVEIARFEDSRRGGRGTEWIAAMEKVFLCPVFAHGK